MRGILAIARRELRSYLASPLGWLVATVFLFVQGYGFYLFVGLLSRPDSPHGAVMRLFFGGTLIYWLFLIGIISVLTMRLIAGERRSGTLETLLSAPVSDTAVIMGKYLGALTFYISLWIPTGVYVVLLWALSGSSGSIDLGPVAAGYLGTFVVGASGLALGLLVSTLAGQQILAALVSFSLLSVFVLLGLVDLVVSTPWIKAILARVNLFQQMDDFGRGIVDTRVLILHGSLVMLFGVLSILVLRRRRGAIISTSRFHRARALMTPLGLALLVVITGLVNVIASRHYARGDWTRRHVYALSAKSKAILKGLKKPVALKLLMAEPGRGSESVYRDLDELLKRLALASPKISVERVDIDLQAARAEIVAREHHVSRAELREGVVVVAAGRRAKVIPARVLAEYDETREGRRLQAFRGEAVLLSAILGATRRASPQICFSKGHGEAPIDSYAARGYGYLADAVRRDGYRVRDLGPRALLAMKTKELVTTCKVIIIGGPTTAFAPVETDALDRYLHAMGHLFVLVGPILDRSVTRYGKVGLETFCARWGILLPKTIVIDPVGLPGEQPLMTWATRDGYGDHPIGRALAGRLTVWPLARELRPGPSSLPGLRVTALVSTSAKGWAESDLASLKGARPLTFDAALDHRGPVIVAAAVSLLGPRIVIFGTERGLLNRRLARETVRDFNEDLFLAGLAWLSDEMALVAVGPKTPGHIRLALDDAQLGRIFLLTVLVLPAMALFLGVVAWWRRRR